ncbi:MAG: hypothetical protein V4695_07410 [Pseudomonadota bacterium]
MPFNKIFHPKSAASTPSANAEASLGKIVDAKNVPGLANTEARKINLSQAKLKNLPKRQTSAGSPTIPNQTQQNGEAVAQELKQWVEASPTAELPSRKKIAEIILGQTKPTSKTLTITDQSVTSLPQCLSQLAVTKLVLDCTNLQMLPSLPSKLAILKIRANHLETLPRLPETLRYLETNGSTKLSVLPTLPRLLAELLVRNNGLRNLPILPTNLKSLDVSCNQLSDLPTLPNGLAELNISFNGIVKLDALPSALKKLEASRLELERLPKLPAGLLTLMVNNNQLYVLPTLPASLKKLNVSNNYLRDLPDLPASLKNLQASSNALHCLPELPKSMTSLDAADNKLTELPKSIMNVHALASISIERNQIPTSVLVEFVQSLREQSKDFSQMSCDDMHSVRKLCETQIVCITTSPPGEAAKKLQTATPVPLPAAPATVVNEFESWDIVRHDPAESEADLVSDTPDDWELMPKDVQEFGDVSLSRNDKIG